MRISDWSSDVCFSDLLYGPFLTCRRFVRGLDRARTKGRIVNISSIHERAPRPGGVDYDAAKGGLAQLTATLALELAPQGIAVNGVRSEERRVGKECVSTCRSRGSPDP